MNLPALQGVDLNQLRALHVLLDETNVGRAARRLGITPPAASNALRRLRALFGDPLLVRAGRSMVRTSVGEGLRGRAVAFVLAAEALIADESGGFEAANWRGNFSLMTSDYVYLALGCDLEMALGRQAPGIDLTLAAVVEDSAAWLREHDGLAIGPFHVPNSDVQEEPLFRDRMVLAVRSDHPLARGRVTLRRYASVKHVLVAPRGRPGSLADAILDDAGYRRRVARVVTTHSLAAHILASSDCVSTLPERLMAVLGARFGLVARALPFDLPPLDFRVSWHRRHEASPIHTFMRGVLRDALAS